MPAVLFFDARDSLHWRLPLFKLWACSLVLAYPVLAAELTLSAPLAIDQITHSSARACWTTTGAVLASKQLAFDTTAQFMANNALAFKTVGTTSQSWSSMCMALSGLTAGTSYTVGPSITSGANSTVLTSSGNANSRATFTTSALPSPHPALPVAPTTFSTTYPSIDSTLTVALDCSDRTAKLTTAYASANQTVKVVMPSLATQTSTNCNLPLNLSGFTKTGTGWVVITSSAEGSGPPAGTRTSTANKSNSWMLCTSANTPALDPTGNTRFVDLYLEPCDSAATSGQGDPRVTQYLTRFDYGGTGLPNMVYDRTNFDGRGYPYRLMNAVYGYGDNVAFIDSYFNHVEVWEPWVNTTSISRSGNQIVSSLAFLMGRGDTTNAIGAFTVTQTSGTGNAYLYARAAGAIEYRYSNGTASCASPCTAVLDATLTIPSDAVQLMWDGATQRIAYTAGTFGAQTFWNRQNISAITAPNGAIANIEWDAYGITSDSCSGASPTAQVWMIQNNFIGVTGFGVFPQGACTPNGPGFIVNTSDWTISGNDFQSNNSCLVAFGTVSGLSSPFVCVRRHHFETKNGFRFSIHDNTFSNGFISIGGNGAYAIDMKQDFIGSGSTVGSAVTDIYIGHNTITNDPACFYIAGDTNNTVGTNYWHLITRVEIEQNICNPNAYARSQFFLPDLTTLTNGGMTLWVEEETEDIIVQHNTFYQPVGSVASVVLLSDRWSEGLSLLNNIFYVNSPFTPYRGIQAAFTNDPGWTTASTPAFNTASGSDGTTALNNGILPNATRDVRGNLFIAGCALSPTGVCVDATPAINLVGDLSGQYPASNFWITSGTFGARQDAVGWVNRSSIPAGLFLSPSSIYHNGGTDGHDIGVYVALPPATTSTSITGQGTITGTVTIQ